MDVGDISGIRRNVERLHQVAESQAFQQLVQKVQGEADALIAKHLPTAAALPAPLRRTAAEAIAHLSDAPALSLSRLASLSLLHSTSLLELEKNSCLFTSGIRKAELSSNYLGEIRQKSEEFLSKCGFDRFALPDSYIDEEPRDLEAVRRNERILLAILGAQREEEREGEGEEEREREREARDPFGVIPFVQETVDELYPRLRSFSSLSLSLIFDALGWESEEVREIGVEEGVRRVEREIEERERERERGLAEQLAEEDAEEEAQEERERARERERQSGREVSEEQERAERDTIITRRLERERERGTSPPLAPPSPR